MKTRKLALALAGLAVAILVLGPLAIWLREPDPGGVLPAGVAGRLIEVDGRSVHIVERGEGPALILLHGFGGSTYDFEEHVLPPLSRSRRVVAIDLIGFGWSERDAAHDYDYVRFADQVARTLDALGIERASVAGQSMGGAVATVFAARHPQRIDRLILADAVYPQKPSELALPFRVMRTPVLGELALGLLADASPPGGSAVHHERALAFYRVHGTRAGLLRFVRSPGKPEQLAAAYPKIAAPTLILHGTADTFVPYALMERAAPALRSARIVRLEGGGHFPQRDAPGVFVREVDAFLTE